MPPHPDLPKAPEVPRPVQAEPPSHPLPGAAPPVYPGWEGAAEQSADEQEVPPGASQPSRYDPPTPGGATTVPPRATEPVAGGFPPDPPPPGVPHGAPVPGDLYGAPGPGGPHGASAPGGPYGGPPPGAYAGQGPEPGGAHPHGAPGAPGGQPYGGQPYGGQPYGQQQAQPSPAGGPAYPGPAGYPAPPQGDWPKRGQGGGLGTAALVLGIVSLVLLFACGAGVLTAIVGVVIGIVAVVKDSNRGRAWVGLLLSALALIIAAVFLAWFVNKVGGCLELPRDLQQRCVEERFGIDIRPPG
ncbi:hypothetical protein HS041_01925 [Planomonospora sp. ID67723]|uniref:hypothetical protein n=1 Tax=Planomonospora sp. ID67723 TaxID=2738134 RepID=UPI0018C448F5|nr:hypothetical protein [Planomonospora sp. ID67723]MBG0826540.1 hypothetical protein [Planomonospora sp. ID67723]